MEDIAASIAETLAVRRRLLPRIEQEIHRWRRVDELVVVLDRAVEDLRRYPATPEEVNASLAHLQVGQARAAIAVAVELLRNVETRVTRETVNIGVSGEARVGKSTLLQSISGLGDDHVPTGSGIPVTAVRSRIFHSAGRHRAVIELHTYESFRDEILDAYHRVLGLPSVPWTLADFKEFPYPDAGSLAKAADVPHEHQTILRRLREMRDALWSYEDLLTRTSRTLELSGSTFHQLRSYVAYPTNTEQRSDKPVGRRYLAVRDIRIECPFPHADVENLGIIDLPGLGELAAGAEDHHVEGLQNDVDAVLLVKRAVEGMAFWGVKDSAAVKLIDRARGFVSQRRDFAFIVLNTGGTTAELVDSLRDDVHRNANDGKPGRNFHVLETDARDQRSVFTQVLVPILHHLAERLPVIDEEILAGTRAECTASRNRIDMLARDVGTAVAGIRNITVGVAEDLDRRTVELRKNLAESLAELVADLRDRTADSDPEYLAALDRVQGEITDWIRSGFGMGRHAWCADAVRTMRVDRASMPFTVDQLNRLRVEISNRFAALNIFFQSQVDDMWRQVGRLLARDLGTLLDGTEEGAPLLERLAELLGTAAEPCDALYLAVQQLLQVRLDYRTQLHPLVRPELDGLDPQLRHPDGESTEQIVVPVSRDGAEELYDYLTDLAEQAVYLTRKTLAKQAIIPAQVLFAAVEDFEDQLIRSGASAKEFRRLARSYRDELWPGVYQGLDEANARVARVTRAARNLADAAADLGGM